MTLTEEQVKKAMACKTADELLALAKSWGVEMTREQAEEYLAKMKTMELTDEEIVHVAGGDGGTYGCGGGCKWFPHPLCKGHEPDGPINICTDHCGMHH